MQLMLRHSVVGAGLGFPEEALRGGRRQAREGAAHCGPSPIPLPESEHHCPCKLAGDCSPSVFKWLAYCAKTLLGRGGDINDRSLLSTTRLAEVLAGAKLQ